MRQMLATVRSAYTGSNGTERGVWRSHTGGKGRMTPLAPDNALQPTSVRAGVGPYEIPDGFDLNCAEVEPCRGRAWMWIETQR
jgi:hypothetical protein